MLGLLRDRPLTPADQRQVIADFYNGGRRLTQRKWGITKMALDALLMSHRRSPRSTDETLYEAVQALKDRGMRSPEVAKALHRPLEIINDLWAVPTVLTSG